MKSKLSVESIKSQVNLDQLGQDLLARAEKGEFRAQSPIAALLDTIKPALLKARENKATFSALARYLNERQIPISEASLRKYLQRPGERVKPKKSIPAVGKPAAESTKPAAPVNAPDRLAPVPRTAVAPPPSPKTPDGRL
jgi:hypothetical protein